MNKLKQFCGIQLILALLIVVGISGCATAATNVWLGDQVKTTTVKGSNYVQMMIQRVGTTGAGSNGLWRLITADNFKLSLGLTTNYFVGTLNSKVTNLTAQGFALIASGTPSSDDVLVFATDGAGGWHYDSDFKYSDLLALATMAGRTNAYSLSLTGTAFAPFTVGTNWFVVNTNGRVGIGTNLPPYQFTLAGAGSDFSIDASGVYPVLRNRNSDYLGVASDIFTLLGKRIRTYASDGNKYLEFGHNNTNGNINTVTGGGITFSTTNAERMRITQAGLVGIATNAPTTALEVHGTAKATAFVGDGSGLTGITNGASYDTNQFVGSYEGNATNLNLYNVARLHTIPYEPDSTDPVLFQNVNQQNAIAPASTLTYGDLMAKQTGSLNLTNWSALSTNDMASTNWVADFFDESVYEITNGPNASLGTNGTTIFPYIPDGALMTNITISKTTTVDIVRIGGSDGTAYIFDGGPYNWMIGTNIAMSGYPDISAFEDSGNRILQIHTPTSWIVSDNIRFSGSTNRTWLAGYPLVISTPDDLGDDYTEVAAGYLTNYPVPFSAFVTTANLSSSNYVSSTIPTTFTVTNSMPELQVGSIIVTNGVTWSNNLVRAVIPGSNITGTTNSDGSLTLSASASGGGGTYQTVSNITASGTFGVNTLPLTNTAGGHFNITLTGNATFDAPTNTQDFMRLTVRIIQDGTGGWTLSTNGTADAWWKFGDSVTGLDIKTNAYAVSYFTAFYYAVSNRWDIVGTSPGY